MMISLMREPAGEAGGETIDDFINDFPPAGEAGGKIINGITTATTRVG